MTSTPAVTEFVEAVTSFGHLPRPDRSYTVFRAATAPGVDLARAEHRQALLTWLNAWGCRIRYPREGEPSLFDDNLASWWDTWNDRLPSPNARLASLDDTEIDHLAAAYGDLRILPVAVGRRPGMTRRLGPTATAKTLYAIRPQAVTAWDAKIAQRLHGGRDAEAFGRHLRMARAAADALVSEAGGESQLLAAAGRPTTSVAKLLDEYWYVTVTLGRQPTPPSPHM